MTHNDTAPVREPELPTTGTVSYTFPVTAEINLDTTLGRMFTACPAEVRESTARGALQRMFDDGNNGAGMFGEGVTIKYNVVA